MSFLINPYAMGTGGGGGPPTFPTIASIWEWWEPARNGFANNDRIATLAGQVSPGAGHDFTQASAPLQPTYVENIVNGVGVVQFRDNDESLQNVNPSALTAAHLFMVIRVLVENSSLGVWQFGTSASGDVYAFTDGVIYDGACSNTRRTVGDPTLVLTDWRVIEVTSISGEWDYKLDGAHGFTGGTTLPTASNTVALNTNCKIGTWGVNERQCDIAGVYLFSAKLGTTDRNAMVAYLNDRFGLSIS